MNPRPTNITYRREEKVVEVSWESGETSRFAYSYLREECPCAGCKGHAPGEVPRPVAPPDIGLEGIEPVGQYGVSLRWNDGHSTGIFSFGYLWELAQR